MTESNNEPAAARILDTIIGITFIAGAALKALDMPAFFLVIAQYHVIDAQSSIVLAGWSALIIETAVGAALLASARFGGVTHLVGNLMLLVFTGLIIYAWAFHDLADCGCFGGFLTMSPAVSVLKNVVMIAMLCTAWFMHKGQAPYEWPKLGVAGAVVGVAAVFLSIGYGQQQEQIAREAQVALSEEDVDADRPFAKFVFEIDGETINLGEGEYLVAALSATCDHCMATVPQLNELSLFPELPKVVALMLGDPGEMETFRSLTSPEFPHVSIDNFMFIELANIPPRFHYVVDGVGIQHWDNEPPTMEELLTLEPAE